MTRPSPTSAKPKCSNQLDMRLDPSHPDRDRLAGTSWRRWQAAAGVYATAMRRNGASSRVQGRATGLVVAARGGRPGARRGSGRPGRRRRARRRAGRSRRCPAKASELLERPGDQDWYSILGRNPDDSVNAVFVRVLQTTPTCTTPLRVALFNPEQRWMRTTQASPGNVATVLVPGLTSRYLVRVSSTEPACIGPRVRGHVRRDRSARSPTARRASASSPAPPASTRRIA